MLISQRSAVSVRICSLVSSAAAIRREDASIRFDAVVIGEYERAFYGSQYALVAPLFEHYAIQLWMPEAGGQVDFCGEGQEAAMLALGSQSKREITRTRIRVRTAMAAQAREQGRYLGGRPPYGYRLADAGPNPAIPAARCGTGSPPPWNWSTRPIPGSGTGRSSGGTYPTGGSFPPAPALVSEEDFIAVQGVRSERQGTDAGRCYRPVRLCSLPCGHSRAWGWRDGHVHPAGHPPDLSL
jgi:hypothetical protein